MSTRSLIAKQTKDGRYKAIYCHFDGYVSGVGVTLDANYDTEEKVDELISLGDISALMGTIEKTRGKAYKEGHQRIYAKHDLENLQGSGIEYVYLYVSNGLWNVYDVYGGYWDLLPNLLKEQGLQSKFAERWDANLGNIEKGDAYMQMRRAEEEGKLADLLMDALDSLSEEDYESFRKRWSEVWASHVFYKKEG